MLRMVLAMADKIMKPEPARQIFGAAGGRLRRWIHVFIWLYIFCLFGIGLQSFENVSPDHPLWKYQHELLFIRSQSPQVAHGFNKVVVALAHGGLELLPGQPSSTVQPTLERHLLAVIAITGMVFG